MNSYLRRRVKGFIALATAVLTSAQTVFGPDEPWLSIALAVIGALGVYFVQNEPMPEGAGKHSVDPQDS